MADRLTQIQDCLDQLLTQMYATIKYIDTRHAYTSIPPQADQFASTTNNTTSDAPQSTQNDTQSQTQTQAQQQSQEGGGAQQPELTGTDPQPDDLFDQRLQELAQDLVVKEQQIEALVATLPGVGSSQDKQEAQLADLQRQLLELDEEAKEWAGEKTVLVGRLEGRLEGIGRV
jgi:mediator of RNA polymerase II transcription subunit 21